MGSKPMAAGATRWALLGVLIACPAVAGDLQTTAPSSDSFPVVTDVRVGGGDTQTRFVMDLSRKIDLNAFTLADPYRVVIDIPQVTFQLPPNAGQGVRGLIK